MFDYHRRSNPETPGTPNAGKPAAVGADAVSRAALPHAG
jgi:hypothetical protein